jgi:hypothetical protein
MPGFWRQSLMTKFAHKKDRRATSLFKWAQHNNSESKNRPMSCLLLHNDVICQGDMFTGAKKVIPSVCCVVSCCLTSGVKCLSKNTLKYYLSSFI